MGIHIARSVTRYGWSVVAFLFLVVSAGHPARAQQAFYTFTSGPTGDGFVWDFDQPPFGLNDLPDGETFFAPTDNGDVINIENFSGNVTFFDTQYQAAGNSTHIDAEAWWGNPLTGGNEVSISFSNTTNGFADTIQFDFAWALAGQNADPFLEITFFDPDGGEAYESYDLDDIFPAGGAFGGFDGAAGTIDIDASLLLDDLGEPLSGIESMMIDVSPVATLGGTGEFAIDNLSINAGGGGVPGSNVFPSVNGGTDISGAIISRNQLVGTGMVRINQEITNNGTDSTTYSTSLAPGGNLADPGQVNGAPIDSGQSMLTPVIATLDSNLPSGTYASDLVVTNNLNPADPDNQVTREVRLHDPVVLTVNNSTPLGGGDQVTITNANVEPHAGALRAADEISSIQVIGPFTLSEFTGLTTGFLGNEFVTASSTATANISFQSNGLLSGIHQGTITVEHQHVSDTGFYLAGATPQTSIVWNLQHTLTDMLAGTAPIAADESFANLPGVNNPTTAIALIDGVSSSSQDVSLQITGAPPSGNQTVASVATSTVDLSFDSPGDLYVLQFTYTDANLPADLDESDLQLLYFDPVPGDWTLAIRGNSDGGAGGAMFAGGYADYLDTLGGGVLDTSDLSAYGVDTANNHAWAVLDHASQFTVGQFFFTADFNRDGTVGSLDLAQWKNDAGQSAGSDADFDGDSDGNDFLAWQRQLGSQVTTVAAQMAIPEPASWVLLLLAGLLAPKTCPASETSIVNRRDL